MVLGQESLCIARVNENQEVYLCCGKHAEDAAPLLRICVFEVSLPLEGVTKHITVLLQRLSVVT